MSQPKQTIDEHITALAVNIPAGRVWLPKFQIGTNFYNLLKGFAPTFREMDAAIQRFAEQNFWPETEDFLSEVEAAIGLPDDCFSIGGDVASRQLAIKIKLVTLRGIQTEADFVALAALFGLSISVNSGIEHLIVGDGGYGTALPALTVAELATPKIARFTMVVVETFPDAITFPWDFPLLFSSSAQTTLRCLIRKLAPANVQVLFEEAP